MNLNLILFTKMILKIRSTKWYYQKSVSFSNLLSKVKWFCYFGFLKPSSKISSQNPTGSLRDLISEGRQKTCELPLYSNEQKKHFFQLLQVHSADSISQCPCNCQQNLLLFLLKALHKERCRDLRFLCQCYWAFLPQISFSLEPRKQPQSQRFGDQTWPLESVPITTTRQQLSSQLCLMNCCCTGSHSKKKTQGCLLTFHLARD